MAVKPIDVLSIYANCYKVFKKLKYVDIDKRVFIKQWENSKPFIVTKCEKIWNDIQNSYYSLDDFKIYLLHNYLLGGKCGWSDIITDDIVKVIKLYDKPQFIIDQQTILEISKEISEITNIKDYFYINEDGESLVYSLIINKHVNPIFYCNMLKYLEDVDFEEELLEHKKFRFLIKVISAELGVM